MIPRGQHQEAKSPKAVTSFHDGVQNGSRAGQDDAEELVDRRWALRISKTSAARTEAPARSTHARHRS
jgi:hypothetical protein